jgi:excinuclease ABC subunit A
VDTGNTVIVIEHNLDVIKTADWIVDLGPEGGARGGMIVGEGTPEQIAAIPDSATGEYLARVLRGEPLVPLSEVTFADVADHEPADARTASPETKRAVPSRAAVAGVSRGA